MERREVAKADPKSSFISEAAVRFRRIKEAALELLQQPGFEYTYENLRSFCSFKHIPFDPSHTKTNFRDAIAGLKQEGFADTFLEQRASVILSAIKAETEAKRAVSCHPNVVQIALQDLLLCRIIACGSLALSSWSTCNPVPILAHLNLMQCGQIG